MLKLREANRADKKAQEERREKQENALEERRNKLANDKYNLERNRVQKEDAA